MAVVVIATLVGVAVHARPVGGEADVARLTLPAKPFRPVTVIVEVPVAPAFALTLFGLARTVKS